MTVSLSGRVASLPRNELGIREKVLRTCLSRSVLQKRIHRENDDRQLNDTNNIGSRQQIEKIRNIHEREKS